MQENYCKNSLEVVAAFLTRQFKVTFSPPSTLFTEN